MPLSASREQARSKEQILVSRQPVVDRDLRLRGYRLAYAPVGPGPAAVDSRPGVPSRTAEPGRAADALQLLHDLFNSVGLEQYVGKAVAHVPISPEMLLTVGLPPVNPRRIVLRVGYDDILSGRLGPMLAGEEARQFTFELDGLPGPQFRLDLLDGFGIVEVDLRRWRDPEIAALVDELRSQGRVLLAAGVLDHARRDAAVTLGFELFTGPFIAKPVIVTGRAVPSANLGTLVSVARLQGAATPLEELIVFIERDVGLSVRLLRYINSAHFGFAKRIRSVRHAAALLGSQGIRQWAILTATTECAPGVPPMLTSMALIRARMCEQLAGGDDGLDGTELFTIGLLSMADTLLGIPIERIVSELPLTEGASRALVEHAGSEGEVLSAVIAYEQGRFDEPALEPRLSGCGAVYRDALAWSRAAMSMAV